METVVTWNKSMKGRRTIVAMTSHSWMSVGYNQALSRATPLPWPGKDSHIILNSGLRTHFSSLPTVLPSNYQRWKGMTCHQISGGFFLKLRSSLEDREMNQPQKDKKLCCTPEEQKMLSSALRQCNQENDHQYLRKESCNGKNAGNNSKGLNSRPASTGTVFGAIALITGTSVGAGVLALPVITAPAGFFPSAAVMALCWGFLVLEACLLAEINVALMQQQQKQGKLQRQSEVLSLRTMAEQTMGPLGGVLTTITYLFLSYTLMVAYIAKSGEVLSLLLHLPASPAEIIFTFGFGGFLYLGGTKIVDSMNQVLTTLLVGLFLLIVGGGASVADWGRLVRMDWAMAPQTLPIIFLALVYHDLTPVLCAYLGGDMVRIRTSIIVGSAVPLAMFVSWDAIALSLAPVSGSADPIDILIRLGGSGPALIIEIFSLLAVATSFIGTVLGLSEFFMEQLGNSYGSRVRGGEDIRDFWEVVPGAARDQTNGTTQFLSKWLRSNSARACSFLLVLAPPLAASSFVSDAFFSAADLAGGYAMPILYGVVPPAMAWNLHLPLSKLGKGQQPESPVSVEVPGGKFALGGMGACACAVILAQLLLHPPQFPNKPAAQIVFAGRDHSSLLETNLCPICDEKRILAPSTDHFLCQVSLSKPNFPSVFLEKSVTSWSGRLM